MHSVPTPLADPNPYTHHWVVLAKRMQALLALFRKGKLHSATRLLWLGRHALAGFSDRAWRECTRVLSAQRVVGVFHGQVVVKPHVCLISALV